MAYTSTHLVQITDTTDRTAMLKIRSAYARNLGAYGLRDVFVDVAGAPSTLDIGVTASELIHNRERPDRLILALNCAPPDKKEGTTDNVRNDFFFSSLGDNIIVGGTNNGYEFSYLKHRIKRLFRLTTTNDLKSQFRSLEILPKHIVRFSVPAEFDKLFQSGELQEVEDINAMVPDVPDVTHVIEVDNFRNVKLFTSKSDRERLLGAKQVRFGFGKESIEFDADQKGIETPYEALVAPTLFAAALGTNIVALKSSSRMRGDEPVEMLATIRARPGETEPNYSVPKVGQPVRFMF